MMSQSVHPVVQQQPYSISAPPPLPMYPGLVQPVLLQQPQMGPPPQRDWNSGLCACCNDVGGCLMTYFCGHWEQCCCLSGRMGEHCCTPICLSCIGGSSITLITYRVKLRARHNIRGSIMDDCCISCCCGGLVQCQIKRELDHIENDLGYKPAF